MRRPLLVALLLSLACSLLGGCVVAAVGTAAVVGGRVAHDRRSASTVLNDRNLQLSVDRAIDDDKALASHNNIRVVVYNRVILLVGEVTYENARLRAGELASGFIGARKVVNQLDVLPEQGFWARRGDNALGSRIKTGLLDITSLPGFDPSRVSITVAHRVVYLMGLVTHAEGDAVVDNARSTRGVDHVVNLFEYTGANGQPEDAGAPATAASAAPAPATSVTTYPVHD
jgi:osmotically-inducible protein OsmY